MNATDAIQEIRAAKLHLNGPILNCDQTQYDEIELITQHLDKALELLHMA